MKITLRNSSQTKFMNHIRSLVAITVALGCFNVSAHIPFLTDEEFPSLAPVIEATKDSVVNISVTTRQAYNSWFDQWGRLNPSRGYRDVQSAGSGVIIDAERGLVITNHHVIEHANKFVITLQDRRSFEAKFLGSDPDTDIAVLQIDADNLTALSLANSDQLRVGDFVLAIGNPFGLGQSVTTGIVSALGRNEVGIVHREDFIQTDASINPGNSGGALIDLTGNLVGINTAILSTSGSSSGIGFAIPANMVRVISEQLIEHGDVNRGVFGIEYELVDKEIADKMALPTVNGVMVVKVITGSGADKAGMRIDDVITAIDGKPIENSSDLLNRIALLRVGQSFDITVIRDGSELQIQGTVQAAADGSELVSGVFVENIPASHPHYGRIRGIVVSAVDDRLNRSQLMVDDIVTSINRSRISNMTDLARTNTDSRPLILGVLRGTQQFRIIFRN